jgi:hypothetical protein
MAFMKELFGEKLDMGPAGHLDSMLLKDTQEDATGLVEKEVEVHRDGKTFKRKQKVRLNTEHVPQEHHGRVKALASKLVQKARELAVKLTPAAIKVGAALGVILDTPADMKKFAYNPSVSGAKTATNDFVSANMNDAFGVGVSGHIVASGVAYVLSHALTWLKNKVKSKSTTEDAAPGVMEFAEFVHELYKHAFEYLSLKGKLPSIETIAGALTEMLK